MAIFFGDFGASRKPTTKIPAWADDSVISTVVNYERRARALRGEIFDANVINDASWPLLQDLFAARLEGVKMRTKELCATSGLPQTTVLRYLDHLEKFEVIRRESDPDDNRVTLVSVTDAGMFWMREYYSHVIRAEQKLAKAQQGIFALDANAAGSR